MSVRGLGALGMALSAQTSHVVAAAVVALFAERSGTTHVDQTEGILISMRLVAREARWGDIGARIAPVAGIAHDLHLVHMRDMVVLSQLRVTVLTNVHVSARVPMPRYSYHFWRAVAADVAAGCAANLSSTGRAVEVGVAVLAPVGIGRLRRVRLVEVNVGDSVVRGYLANGPIAFEDILGQIVGADRIRDTGRCSATRLAPHVSIDCRTMG